MDRKSYQLIATREGRWWIIDVPEVGYRTQARTLAEVDAMGRDLIAGALDLDPGSFDLARRLIPPHRYHGYQVLGKSETRYR